MPVDYASHSAQVEAIREELNAPIQGQRVQTLGRLVCFALKDKDGQKSEAGAK